MNHINRVRFGILILTATLLSAPAAIRAQDWVATSSMSYDRVEHTATRLRDGKVLVAGGAASPDWAATPTAELYDPATGTWTLTGSMNYGRGGGHSATLLSNGKVLVVGGSSAQGQTPTAELYDPATGTWTLTGSMNYGRSGHTAALLNDGKLLAAGGDSGGTAELYDPATGTWTLTGSMNSARWGYVGALLTDGTVLVGGGTTSPGSCADPPFCTAPIPSATAEVYDRVTGAWRVTGAMTNARVYHAAALLSNGRVLVTGGALGCGDANFLDSGEYPLLQLDSAEEYDPVTGTWVARTYMQTTRYLHTATLLNDGRVLAAGGIFEAIQNVSIADDGEYFRQCEQILPTGAAETYRPASPSADAEPPDTSITSAVNGNGAAVADGGISLSNAITFGFSGSDNVEVAGFECQLDNAGFIRCPNPLTYNSLALTRHIFEVRAVDTSNNRDATPAAYTWTVDSAPETTITSGVDRAGRQIPNGGTTSSNAITFSFTGTDNTKVAGFECSLDGAAFTPCASPINEQVKVGAHLFQVRAIDNNAFRDATPAAFSWTRR